MSLWDDLDDLCLGPVVQTGHGFQAPLARGPKRRGSTHPRAVLTEDLVRSIRIRHQNGQHAAAIANTYGVSRSTIDSVLSGKTWRHVR